MKKKEVTNITKSQIQMFKYLLMQGCDLSAPLKIMDSGNGAVHLLDLAVSLLDFDLVKFLVVECHIIPRCESYWSPPADTFLLDVYCSCPRLKEFNLSTPEGWSIPKGKCRFQKIRHFMLQHGALDYEFCQWDLAIIKSMEFVQGECTST